MKDKIQYEKAIKKFEILKDIINGLTEYNNITDYHNQKDFTIIIDYILNEDCYVYDVKIIRGNIQPKIILDIRIKYKDKLDELIFNMLEELTNNEYFYYTNYTKGDYNKYIINMKNNIRIEFPIKDLCDKKIYNTIEAKYKEKNIENKYNSPLLNNEMKNKVQELKAIKNISIIKNVFEKLGDLNSLQDYDNIKPYKLNIICSKDQINNCYKYYLKITKGNTYKAVLLDFSTSIINNEIIYENLHEIIYKYLNSESYTYTGLKNNYNKDIFSICMKNQLEIEIECEEIEDKIFFRKIFNFNNLNEKKHIKKLTKNKN